MKTKHWIGSLLTTSAVVVACTVAKSPQQQMAVALEDVADPKPVVNPIANPAQLTPEQSLNAFRVPKGYHMELVASEPMIHEPVAIAWDGNARMYVAEMDTYMQDADATGEHEPVSRVMLLEDTDGDGKMDKSSVFIDHLLLPRMLLCVNHELIVNETDTYDMWSYKDTNGDGVADDKKQIYHVDRKAPGNLEHQRSGLDWNLDNWLYVTVDPVRFRYTNGTITVDSLASGSNGQWGLTHDNYGRLFFSRAGGENAGAGFQINPKYGSLEFADAYDEATFAPVWSIIANPDAQGGAKRLRPDSTLNHFTAGCGQSIYRGDKLPADLVGDYLICEPVARIVRRAHVLNQQGKTRLENAYHEQEFIASSDFNFRPVNTYTGPDGNLYIVDMNRGIIQESQWTPKGSWIRPQIERLGLDKHVQHGRIWRLVQNGATPAPRPHLLDDSPAQLVTYLSHPNGWWRDNAQKQLVALGDKSVVPALQQMASGVQKAGTLARIHALWTLEGLGAIDPTIVANALKDSDPQIRRTAIWLSEPFIRQNNESVVGQVASLQNDPDANVRIQVLESLHYSTAPTAKKAVSDLLSQNATDPVLMAVEASIQKNADFKTYGSKLGSLAVAERNSVLKGAEIFKSYCSSCHGTDGKGLASMVAPPIAGSKHLADNAVLLRILMQGLSGPIDGKTYPTLMPPVADNTDEWIAAVANYVRYEFGGPPPRPTPPAQTTPTSGSGVAGAAPVRPVGGFRRTLPIIQSDEVAKIRQETATRTTPWTLVELEKK
ncbi:c-type cytochrome [Fibrella sp. HMF5335]|uniref:C-type cytochrome n=1 Tax=Fibrella rubiginis TaxID=2817060 RepID=A0A939GCX1_9BACT|nr:c-type cytochrome [Fibrella rubiginis]MBO0935225.1 c-type cytochrome [Fibrella rubiginis]